jgi:hypothetical protein
MTVPWLLKEKTNRKGAKNSQRKTEFVFEFLCGAFASLRLCGCVDLSYGFLMPTVTMISLITGRFLAKHSAPMFAA